MTLPFTIGGARTVIPGVYDSFRVDDSLLSPANTGHSVLLIGESTEGIPGSELDLAFNFFTNYQDVLDFYKSGPIVDAARQLFSAQPSAVFNGQIDRLYVYKTNATTRASRGLSGAYGTVVAARYGTGGNSIKSQILDSQSQVLPSLSFHLVPAGSASTVKLLVNGNAPVNVALGALSVDDETGTAAEFVQKLAGNASVSATGGARKDLLASGSAVQAACTTSGNGSLTVSLSGGTWSTASVKAGDLAVIPAGSKLAAASGSNVGCYLVTAVSNSVVTLTRVSGVGSAVSPLEAVQSQAHTDGELDSSIAVYGKVTLTQTESPVSGASAALEVMAAGAAVSGAGLFLQDDKLSAAVSATAAATASVSVQANGSGRITVSIDTGSWAATPKAGDIAWISESSPAAGATKKNAGIWLVESASYNTMKLVSCVGSNGEAVAASALNGNTTAVQTATGVVTTTVAARRTTAASERQVKVEASRASTGEKFPTTAVGGRVALEINYHNPSAASCSLTIDSTRKMTISAVGGDPIPTVNLNRFETLSDLVEFLNTISGVSARVADTRMKSDSPSVLDAVSGVKILAASATPAYTGRIKRDYADFKRLVDDNFGLIAFAESASSSKCGLPDAEASVSFMTGGAVGSTSNANIQSALDAGLKVDVRVVTPCFSRDAYKDIEDGLTEDGSSYSIDSVHAALLAHVSTASSTLFGRERYGAASFHGSFKDAKEAAAAVANERIQMTFQMCRATSSDGTLKWFQPWMVACAITAGRAQAEAGTPMLRKSFGLTSVKHIGDKSVYDDTLALDFDAEDRGQLTEAIEAGLLVCKSARGAGIRLESPDLTTRSRDGDPKGWVYERASVMFACDEVRQSLRQSLENLIGASTADVAPSDVRRVADSVLRSFQTRGVIVRFAINKIDNLGNGYNMQVDLYPPEALEFIGIDVLAKRNA
ncbi:hypothetical protein UFOVP244_3 [uncultured Caudovirales phage]|uniref:Tail sheath protein subtilisin-like domain-containing protein n=1 Tax=uncultured Caudovirales phage TaxID=2100421 RepID=A0A6J7WV38_9CAUD|nr:hypothetical protein UFOVP244_3 [uncultured Caudovirales phage]